MASNRQFLEFVLDQIENAGEITFKKMFGEYGIYSDGKLFFKSTDSGRVFIGNVVESSPYPGAKPSFLIEDKIDDKKWLSDPARITISELPQPKPRKKK